MTAPLPLAGVRILSLAHLYPGPFATMLLADLGADVIIVEDPRGGDRTRRFPGHFEALNRNKRAIALDLKSRDGNDAFLRLVRTSDVVLEGFRPGVMARLGLDADTLRRHRPDLVFVSISGYGQDGPMHGHGAHDLSLQAAAGMLRVPPGREHETELPSLVLGDIAAATSAALGIVSALYQRRTQDHAPVVDVSMLDCAVAWMAPYLVPHMNGLAGARLPPQDPAYGVFACADGAQITLSLSGEDHLWRSLCGLLGLDDDLARLDEAARIRDRRRIQARLRAVIATRARDELMVDLELARVPHGPVCTLDEVADVPQIRARELIVDHTDPAGGTTRYVRQPLVFDGHRTGVSCRAPRLGEHTEEVLQSAGLTAPEIDRVLAR